MSHNHIRHRFFSRYYMSPILLDHRNLKWIWLSVALLVFVTFIIGYISGFEKSNDKWQANLDPTEITLPNAVISDLTAVEQQVPDIEEPGASIDVDSVSEIVVVKPVTEKTLISEVKSELPQQEIVAEVSQAEEISQNGNIAGDANAATARYSLQVGMYKNVDNADAKMAELLNLDLNTYINEYKNKNDEVRYNVRFGYFSSFSSAVVALEMYQQNYNGSAYVARYVRE